MTPPLDLRAVEARLKAASQDGEWVLMGDGPQPRALDEPWLAHLEAAPGLTIGSTGHTEPICRVSGYLRPVQANAALIAQAPADMAALLAHTRALRAALQPFAAAADYWAAADAGTMLHTERVMVEVSDLRQAAAVLGAAQDGPA